MKPAPQFNRLVLLLIGAALVLSRGVTSSSSSPKAEAGAGESPAQVAQAEPLPPYFYGSGAIPAGMSFTRVYNRFIRSTSRIFLSVDSTALPNANLALAGVKVRSHADGTFTVLTLDRSLAPVTGIPFNYVVFNVSDAGSYHVRSSRIASGFNNDNPTDAGLTTSSKIIVSVDTSAISNDQAIPGLRVYNRGHGVVTITTLDLSTVPHDVPYYYLYYNDADCYLACNSSIKSGFNNDIVSHGGVSVPTAPFVTVDTTSLVNRNVALRGLRTYTHGAGFFQVTSDDLSTAPTGGIPYNYAIFNPPAAWEEMGPTARAGSGWTIQVDPGNRLVEYVGSGWGGVWKTTNGGDTWTSAWQGQRTMGVIRLALAPNDSQTLFAAARDGTFYVTNDGANTWNSLGKPSDYNPHDLVRDRGVYLATPGLGALYACLDSGLYAITIITAWQHLEPPGGTAPHVCTDVLMDTDGSTLYAAFRNNAAGTDGATAGIWRYKGGVWKQIKQQVASVTDANGNTLNNPPARIAVNARKIVLNYECYIYINSLSNIESLSGNALENSWPSSPPRGCDGPTNNRNFGAGSQNGYVLSLAISPTDDKRIIAGAVDAQLTTDGGGSWNRVNPTGYDYHQIVFQNASSDSNVFLAADPGPRFSTDKGLTWKEAETLGFLVDGPPTIEYYNLTVGLPDQFGRALVGGNAQDQGGILMLGRNGGFGSAGGESGITFVAPRSINRTNPLRTGLQLYDIGGDRKGIEVCPIDVPGPDYLAPSSSQEGRYPDAATNCEQATFISPRSPTSTLTLMAINNQGIYSALVGASDGSVYRAVSGSRGKSYERLITVDPQVPVTALYFAADDVALVGYSTGVVISVTSPFASNWTSAFLTAPAFGNAVVSFANRYGDLSDLYAATNKKVFRSNNRGVSWGDVTGTSSALASNLATGVNIAGMVRDANYPYLYVATGRIGQWITEYPGDASVFRSSTPVAGAWSPFAQGLPVGLPIVGIGLSPNKALYIATQGRGIWWRRDIAAVPPNSGLNAPANSASMVNTRQTITTTCSYPSGWHDIHTIDFKMAIGQGPEPGEPLAFWLQFDQDANLIRFYDADSDTWSAGAPGSSGVLSNRYTKLYLSDTKVKGFGPTDPTVQVTWSVEFLPPAAGLELQQYLQVADDFGNITSWDKVGTWQVGSLLSLPLVTR